ncbi:hypothetical protein BDM02DRAFT_3126133 [Thelephora ganbajun]|uniref:Uncharacterized protein n=1 Tax=Thelephora ganbajun TaxID=370292 RepID=A0ACB6ZTC4_THEGA|nr:hypothetical protein BDM02DRAFT_3126133 [Thelephora ganbajun]
MTPEREDEMQESFQIRHDKTRSRFRLDSDFPDRTSSAPAGTVGVTSDDRDLMFVVQEEETSADSIADLFHIPLRTSRVHAVNCAKSENDHPSPLLPTLVVGTEEDGKLEPPYPSPPPEKNNANGPGQSTQMQYKPQFSQTRFQTKTSQQIEQDK